jgi:predicted MPP superfamily phosphohydrolase
MKTTALILFFTVFFIINGLISFYIYTRGMQAIPANFRFRGTCSVVFWIIALSFIAGRILEKVLPSPVAEFIIGIGSIWLGAMLYLFLIVVFLDLVRLVNHFLPLLPASIMNNYPKTKSITLMSALALVALLLFGGWVNSTIPRVKHLSLFIPKKAHSIKGLNVVMASDIHLGTMVGRSRIDTIVSKINKLNPDIVLLPGDIVDEDLAPVIKQNLGDSIKNIHSRFGTYAVTGNHEFIGGVEEACAYLTAHGITMLRDRSIEIMDSFFIVGREDRAVSRTGHKRKGLNELMRTVDPELPIILMDHQPFALEEAVQHGIDLQLSGHTHYGQLWPLNYVVKSIYEVSWGYKRISKTHFYISSGVGTWGPPMRIGNYPEIVQIQLNFQ